VAPPLARDDQLESHTIARCSWLLLLYLLGSLLVRANALALTCKALTGNMPAQRTEWNWGYYQTHHARLLQPPRYSAHDRCTTRQRFDKFNA